MAALLFFFLCIALGVGSVVFLRSLIQNLTMAVGTDARALMTADLEISSTSDFSPSDLAKIEEVVSTLGIIEAQTKQSPRPLWHGPLIRQILPLNSWS